MKKPKPKKPPCSTCGGSGKVYPSDGIVPGNTAYPCPECNKGDIPPILKIVIIGCLIGLILYFSPFKACLL